MILKVVRRPFVHWTRHLDIGARFPWGSGAPAQQAGISVSGRQTAGRVGRAAGWHLAPGRPRTGTVERLPSALDRALERRAGWRASPSVVERAVWVARRRWAREKRRGRRAAASASRRAKEDGHKRRRGGVRTAGGRRRRSSSQPVFAQARPKREGNSGALLVGSGAASSGRGGTTRLGAGSGTSGSGGGLSLESVETRLTGTLMAGLRGGRRAAAGSLRIRLTLARAPRAGD